MSDAPRVAERARPPGWKPPVHPPPAPVAAAVAVPPPARAPSVRPRPPRPASPAASGPPAVPARPGGFTMLAWFLGFRVFHRVADVLSAAAPTGFVEAIDRMVEVGSVALGAALVVGLWRCERWVGRAAIFWLASLAVLGIIGKMDQLAYYSVWDVFWRHFVPVMVIPTVTAAYVWDRARKLPPAPPPAP